MSESSEIPTKSTTTKHTLNKEKFLVAMLSRGWQFSDAYGWTAPMSRTKRQMEQQWIESILEAVECPHE